MRISCHCTTGDIVTTKVIQVTSNSKCSRCYGSDNNSNIIFGYVVQSVNKLTATSSRILCVQARYHLGGGTIKLAELKDHYLKASPTPSIFVSVPTLFPAGVTPGTP